MIVHVPVTLEEYEGDKFVEVTVEVRVTPGEARVDYYPDGSGYPGSPPDAELVNIYVDTVEDVDGEPSSVEEAALYYYLEEHYDLWIERALEYAECN